MERIDLNFGKKMDLIGQGGFSVVRIYEMPNNKKYAVKLSCDMNVKTSDIREISCLKVLSHPCIMNIIDCGYYKDRFFLAMEVAKCDLEHYLYDKENTVDYKFLSYQLLCGLNYCHNRRVMHRDLKPPNILIMNDNTLKITDFGLSRALYIGSYEKLENASSTIATEFVENMSLTVEITSMWYKAPEILMHEKYNYKSDYWAVACILYQMYTRKPLFIANNEFALLNCIIKKLGLPKNGEFDSYAYWKRLQIRNIEVDNSLPEVEDSVFNQIIHDLLRYKPADRLSLSVIINYPYFDTVRNIDKYEDYKIIDDFDALEQYTIHMEKIDNTDIHHAIHNSKIWLLELHDFYLKSPKTYFYAIDLMYYRIYQYLYNKVNIPIQVIGCIGIICYYISCIYNEIYYISIEDIQIASNCIIEDKNIEIGTRDLLRDIDYDLIRSTCYDYYILYSFKYPTIDTNEGTILLYLISYMEQYYEYSPKDIVLTVLFIQKSYHSLEYDIKLDNSSFQECYTAFKKFILSANKSSYRIARNMAYNKGINIDTIVEYIRKLN